MKKSKKIIRDLKHLNFKRAIFGTYDSHSYKESKNLDISPMDIVRALEDYEIDFKKRYNVDFDDVVYEDREGNYDTLELDINADNSYNWSSQVVFNFNVIKVDDRKYITIKFHRFGDVRGNYTDYMVLDMTLDEFYEAIFDNARAYTSIDYKGNTYQISTDVFKEGCCFDIYCDELNLDNYDVVLDIDNYRNKRDIKKALVKYLKEIA